MQNKTLTQRWLLIFSYTLLLTSFSCLSKVDNFVPPFITGFEPTSGIVGTPVTITGGNFSTNLASNIIKFNGIAATVTSATDTELIVKVPELATTGPISLALGNAKISTDINFEIPSPTITDFSPTIAATGISVVINGNNFSTVSAYDIVKFNGSVATVTNATKTRITATVPSAATTGKITVTVGANTATSSTDFTKCSGNAELIITNLAITSIDAGRTSFNYEYDLTNVGDAPADLTKMGDQAYVSTDNAVGNDQAASGWSFSTSTLNVGQTIHVSFSSNIVGGGTVDDHPYLIVVVSGTVSECNTANNTVIKSIL